MINTDKFTDSIIYESIYKIIIIMYSQIIGKDRYIDVNKKKDFVIIQNLLSIIDLKSENELKSNQSLKSEKKL